MGGTRRMDDPSERIHDRRRRWLMNAVLVMILAAVVVQWRSTGLAGWRVLEAVLLVCAGVPLAITPRVWEIRFKMSRAEYREALTQLPRSCLVGWVVYGLLVVGIVLGARDLAVWMLPGAWAVDFVSYYHDRPQRMRHLYAITSTLDDLRNRRTPPWCWALPVIGWWLWLALR